MYRDLRNNFKCPECGHKHYADDYDLWEYWDRGGDEFQFQCNNCEEFMNIKVRLDTTYTVESI